MAVSVLVAIVLGGATARAGDPETERARALFEEAGELERRGQWGAAQDRLHAALKLHATPQLYYALGWALENDDKLIEAKAEYETASRLGRDRPGGEEASRLSLARLTALEKKTPVLKVHVAGGAKSSARVFVDGREIKRDEDVATTSLNPGTHALRVERASSGAVEQVVYVGRGTVQTVDADATEVVAARDASHDRHGRAPARSGTAAPVEASTAQGPGAVPWILLTGGVAFLAGGGALLISADADSQSRDEAQARWCTATACAGTTATRAETTEAVAFRREAEGAAETGNTKQAVGFALGGAGLVAATVGTILLLRGGDQPETPRGARASASPLPGGFAATAAFSF